jgi:hypothetical protein
MNSCGKGISEFNARFSAAAAEKRDGIPAYEPDRSELDLHRAAERVVAKDNTVAIANRLRQIDKTRFRSTLAGCTVMIRAHLDGTVSIGFGSPWWAAATKKERGWTGLRQKSAMEGREPAPTTVSCSEGQETGGPRRLKSKPDGLLIKKRTCWVVNNTRRFLHLRQVQQQSTFLTQPPDTSRRHPVDPVATGPVEHQIPHRSQ